MTDALSPILSHKINIDTALTSFLEEKRTALSVVNQWALDSINRLIPFVSGGKSVRGCLVVYSASLYGKKPDNSALSAAAAMELVHAGLLIHDDIADQDSHRRGRLSLHVQYEKHFGAHPNEASHLGESMAIHIGDLCYLFANELFARAHISPNTIQRVMHELQCVLVAQMQDVAAGRTDQTISADDVLSTYRYKTARYTFSLPFLIGASLGDVSDTDDLEALGEDMGILYQLRDDELNARGDSAKTGKPTGSDERNNRQTLAHILPKEAYTQIRSRTEASARDRIATLPVPESGKAALSALLMFCLSRDR